MFTMPDLVVESILREGFSILRKHPEIIDDIFESLIQDYSEKKYGEKELQRIKDIIAKKDWSFVHSFGEVESNLPCVSIQLGNESEAKEIAHMEDYENQITEPITDPEELAALVKVSNVEPFDYDKPAGILYIPDGVDLSDVYANLVFQDTSGAKFTIIGAIDDTDGQKQFAVAPGSDVNITGPGQIQSSIDYKQYERRGVHSEVQILLGIHTKDALYTKYMYLLVKFMLLARKKDLIKRNFINSSFQGSDFTRNLKYEADMVFTRFLTLSGKLQDSFTAEQAAIFDRVKVITKVPKDVATTEDLDKEDSTVQVGETPQEE